MIGEYDDTNDIGNSGEEIVEKALRRSHYLVKKTNSNESYDFIIRKVFKRKKYLIQVKTSTRVNNEFAEFKIEKCANGKSTHYKSGDFDILILCAIDNNKKCLGLYVFNYDEISDRKSLIRIRFTNPKTTNQYVPLMAKDHLYSKKRRSVFK